MSQLILSQESSDPAAPGGGKWELYFKSTGLYARNNAGTIIGPFDFPVDATELTLSSDAITITQSTHKLQPQSGTSDNLSTISGTSAGQRGILYISDFGTDTITIKHNVGNILCVGSMDIALSNGCVFWYSNGTKVFVSGNAGIASATAAGMVELATDTEALTGTDTTRAITPANLKSIVTTLFPPRGHLLNGKLSVFVSSNDLFVAIVTLAGTDPSASDPVYVRIGNTIRTITASCFCQIPDGTNWYKLGGVELGTIEQDLFAYVVWDSNSSVVAVTAARIPWGNLVSDFSVTTTDEKHLFNYSNFTTTDEVEVIGRFGATLSLAGTSHLWTVPTFTAANMINRPIHETRWLTWAPVSSTSGSLTYTSVTYPLAKYRLSVNKLEYEINSTGTLGGTASNRISFTLPFESAQSALTNPPLAGLAWTSDTNVGSTGFIAAATPDRLDVFKDNLGNYNNSGTCVIRSTGFYEA